MIPLYMYKLSEQLKKFYIITIALYDCASIDNLTALFCAVLFCVECGMFLFTKMLLAC